MQFAIWVAISRTKPVGVAKTLFDTHVTRKPTNFISKTQQIF